MTLSVAGLSYRSCLEFNFFRSGSAALFEHESQGTHPEAVLAVRCPTCGAAPQERCELTSGQSRTEPHRDRRLMAADDLDT